MNKNYNLNKRLCINSEMGYISLVITISAHVERSYLI